MSHRDDLIAALLHDPTDMLLRTALADAIEEEGIPHVPALVRVMPALCEAKPSQARQEQADLYIAKPYRFLSMPNLNMSLKNEKWRGLHSIGRLAGIAAAHLAVRDLTTGQARGALLRHLLACELYAARVIDTRQRDFLGYESPDDLEEEGVNADREKKVPVGTLGTLLGERSRLRILWRLRGGSAGNAIPAMIICEQAHLWKVYCRELKSRGIELMAGYRHWHEASRRSAFAQVRLRHLAILDCVASLKEPWAAALALYHEHRQKVRDNFDRSKWHRLRAYRGLREKLFSDPEYLKMPGLPEGFFDV